MIRLLLADDHEVVRLGLKTLLSRHPEFEIVAEAGTIKETVTLALNLEPDIVIMDIRFPEGSGTEACREIKSGNNKIKVIMLTSYADDDAVTAAILAGAEGYVLKQIRVEDLIEAIKKVHAGQSLLDPQITEKVLANYKKMINTREIAGQYQLSSQEAKILELISKGMTNKEIAAQVFLSEKTVRNYVSTMLGKLNLANRSQAAAFAAKHFAKGKD